MPRIISSNIQKYFFNTYFYKRRFVLLLARVRFPFFPSRFSSFSCINLPAFRSVFCTQNLHLSPFDFLSIYLALYLPLHFSFLICLSVSLLYIYLCLCPFTSTSAFPSSSPSLPSSLSLSIYLYLTLYIRIFYIFLYAFFYLSIFLYLHLSFARTLWSQWRS